MTRCDVTGAGNELPLSVLERFSRKTVDGRSEEALNFHGCGGLAAAACTQSDLVATDVESYDLCRAPTDAATLKRQLLVANTHQFYGFSVLKNGYDTDSFFRDAAAMKSAVYVVEVATGRAWISALPDNHYWGKGAYPP